MGVGKVKVNLKSKTALSKQWRFVPAWRRLRNRTGFLFFGSGARI